MLRATCNCHKMLSNLWIWICVDMCGCVAWGPLEPSRTQHCQLRLSRQLMELASNTQALESNTLLGVLAPWGKDVGFRHAQFREASPDIGWWGNHQAENYTWAWYFFIYFNQSTTTVKGKQDPSALGYSCFFQGFILPPQVASIDDKKSKPKAIRYGLFTYFPGCIWKLWPR
jgi:hypothetical protein